MSASARFHQGVMAQLAQFHSFSIIGASDISKLIQVSAQKNIKPARCSGSTCNPSTLGGRGGQIT